MNAEEIAEYVDELEVRLERLRVLYDQYFTGIEKIPPSIVQKDVDRRIWVLRREKIRNTGTRFKFQTIIQRYNTFNSYWTRILREIENGTYKRDVMKAKRRFGIDTSKAAPAKALESAPPPSHDSYDLDVEMEVEEDALAALSVNEAPSTFDEPSTKMPAAPPAPPQKGAPLRLPAPADANAPRPILPGFARPPLPSKPAAPAPAPPVAAPQPQPRSPVAPQAPARTSQAAGIVAKKVSNDDDLDDMLDAALGVGPARPAVPSAAPAPRVAPAAPQPAAPQRPAPAAPAVQRPAVAARPAPAPAPAAAAKGGEEYRRVYAQYVEAKRKNGESTAGITYDSLAKSLRETQEKLKTKSGGKAIDFEVAVKDGKTILKPVVR